jgi:hypothetical protein
MSVTLLLRTAVSSLLKRPVTRLAALILPKQTRPEPRIPRDRACIVVVDLSACPYRVRTVCREDRAACAEWHRVTCRCWASHSALQARRDFYGREAVGHGHRHLRSSGHRPRRCRRDLRWRVGQSRVATPEEVRPPTTRPSRAIVLCSLRSPLGNAPCREAEPVRFEPVPELLLGAVGVAYWQPHDLARSGQVVGDGVDGDRRCVPAVLPAASLPSGCET